MEVLRGKYGSFKRQIYSLFWNMFCNEDTGLDRGRTIVMD
jgi:hypothetical protein